MGVVNLPEIGWEEVRHKHNVPTPFRIKVNMSGALGEFFCHWVLSQNQNSPPPPQCHQCAYLPQKWHCVYFHLLHIIYFILGVPKTREPSLYQGVSYPYPRSYPSWQPYKKLFSCLAYQSLTPGFSQSLPVMCCQSQQVVPENYCWLKPWSHRWLFRVLPLQRRARRALIFVTLVLFH